MLSKKEMEQCALDAARKAGAPIPTGELEGEEPDFRFQTPPLGIDVSELVRPACTNYGILPLEQERFRQKILDSVRQECAKQGVSSIYLHVYFTDPRGKKQYKRELIKSLTEVVTANYEKAAPYWSLEEPNLLPEGFDQIQIFSGDGEWWSATLGRLTASQIPLHLAACIAAKEIKLPAYRKNLPSGAEVWLLLYSGVTIPRSVNIPGGIREWKFPFEFDRVFWFSFLENEVVELQRGPQTPENYPDQWIRMEFVCECGTKCRIDVELLDGPFVGHAYQHCGTTTGRYVPGRVIKMWEGREAELTLVKR
jgi:hypothetical protein